MTVTFDGVPQLFLRRLYIQGMKQDTLAAQIQRATHVWTPWASHSRRRNWTRRPTICGRHWSGTDFSYCHRIGENCTMA